MTDEVYWDAYSDLENELGREPEYEEVQEYLKIKFKASPKETEEYFRRLYIKSLL